MFALMLSLIFINNPEKNVLQPLLQIKKNIQIN